MLLSSHTIVYYINRNMVLHLLAQIMRKRLHWWERKIILLHCGFGREGTADFAEIAEILSMPSAEYVQTCYIQAIEKVREVVPNSALAQYIFCKE